MIARVKYTGEIPGADSGIYVLFDSTQIGVANFFAMSCSKRFVLDIKHDEDGTLNAYKSEDRGATWLQVTTDAVTAPASTGTNVYDYLVETYADWKLEWVNGGAAQTVWGVDMALTDERGPAS